jgi:hypothetical protein
MGFVVLSLDYHHNNPKFLTNLSIWALGLLVSLKKLDVAMLTSNPNNSNLQDPVWLVLFDSGTLLVPRVSKMFLGHLIEFWC